MCIVKYNKKLSESTALVTFKSNYKEYTKVILFICKKHHWSQLMKYKRKLSQLHVFSIYKH